MGLPFAPIGLKTNPDPGPTPAKTYTSEQDVDPSPQNEPRSSGGVQGLKPTNLFQDSPSKEEEEEEAIFEEEDEKEAPLLDEKTLVAEWVSALNDIVSRALVPLMAFAGAVAVKLRYDDVRFLLQWKADEKDRLNVVQPADTIADFIKNNRDFGMPLLQMFMDSVQPPAPEEKDSRKAAAKRKLLFDKIGAHPCFDFDDLENFQLTDISRGNRPIDPRPVPPRADASNAVKAEYQRRLSAWFRDFGAAAALQELIGQSLEIRFAPAWAFNVIGSAVFRKLISTSGLAAMEMALAQVNRIPGCSQFTMQELICSKEVHDQFAFLVASNYLSSGDYIPRGGGGNKKRKNNNNTYLNIVQMRNLLAARVMTAHVWFESVRRISNPLLDEFDKKCAAVKRKKENDGEPDAAVRDFETKMARYREMLPQYELIYRPNW